jgi:hypothetical protein
MTVVSDYGAFLESWRTNVLAAQCIECLRRRLILLYEILADDGRIYAHLDTKKGHSFKAVLDEVFGEEHFVNQISWRRLSAHKDAVKYGPIHDMILFYTWRKSYV